jgi:SNF2 family DNA or RNA helicase
MTDKKIPELWDHQKACVAKLKDLSTGALLMEIGTGKTPSMINIMRYKYNTHRAIIPTLIFCPPIVVTNWFKHIKTFSAIPPERVIMLTGPGTQRLEKLQNARKKWGNFFIVITNYESVQMTPLLEEVKDWIPGGMLICDEAHRVKNPQALRTKKVTQIADLCQYSFIMTGTPILNNPMDLFSQYRIMDKGQTFGKNFFAFRNTYFYDRNAGMPKQKYFPDWKIRRDSMQRLGELMESTSFQAKKSECLTLPPLTRTRIDVGMTVPQAKAYEEMRRSFITYVKEEACVAELAITKTLRLQQIIAGFIRTEDGDDVPF